MTKASEIRMQLARLLADQISQSEFSNWFVPYSWNIHLDGDIREQELAEAIDDQLIQPHQDSRTLREALKSILDSSGQPQTIQMNFISGNASLTSVMYRGGSRVQSEPEEVFGKSFLSSIKFQTNSYLVLEPQL